MNPTLATPRLRIALIGNPNTGKSTLFNALTGLRQRVANYPGVTVEKKIGRFRLDGGEVELVDLPGTYSLAAHSPDEMLTVSLLSGEISEERPVDAVLAIVDSSNLERNLYLVSQLLDLGLPLIVALNRVDVARRKGMRIDPFLLERRLGAPVVLMRADRGEGLDRLLEILGQWLNTPPRPPLPEQPFQWPTPIARALSDLRARANHREWEIPASDAHLARLLIDEGGAAEERWSTTPARKKWLRRARCPPADDAVPLSALEVRSRYRWIQQITEGIIERRPSQSFPTDRIDRVLTHRIAGVLIFALLMIGLFETIFRGAQPAMNAIEALFAWFGVAVGDAIPDQEIQLGIRRPGALESLLVDGAIAGISGVVVFLPQILLLFLLIGILEDCGYMARAAFLMDRVMSFCGLSGKSFIPMLSGFACAIPAVMGTRVIENRRDRLATILVTPLMTCSARLPVYTLLIAAFIPDSTLLGGVLGLQAATMAALYALGILSAMVMAALLKRTLLRGPTPPFVLELPTYQWPCVRSLGLRLLDRAMAFLRRAGTVIFAVSVLVWAAAYFPRSATIDAEFAARSAGMNSESRSAQSVESTRPDPAESEESLESPTCLDRSREWEAAHLENSFAARLGRQLEPVFRPLGWDWRITVATLLSLPAREVIVATLGTLFSLGEGLSENDTSLQSALQRAAWPDGRPLFTLGVALSVMVFFALCCQCWSTVIVIRREANSWSWALFTFGYMTILAYVGGAVAHEIGELA